MLIERVLGLPTSVTDGRGAVEAGRTAVVDESDARAGADIAGLAVVETVTLVLTIVGEITARRLPVGVVELEAEVELVVVEGGAGSDVDVLSTRLGEAELLVDMIGAAGELAGEVVGKGVLVAARPVGVAVVLAGGVDVGNVLIAEDDDKRLTLDAFRIEVKGAGESVGEEGIVGTVDVPAGGAGTVKLDPITDAGSELGGAGLDVLVSEGLAIESDDDKVESDSGVVFDTRLDDEGVGGLEY